MAFYSAVYSIIVDPAQPLSVRAAASIVTGFFLISAIGGTAVILNGIYHTYFKKRGA